MFLTSLNADILACLLLFKKIEPEAESGKYFQICFSPIWGKNGGVLSMRMQVILDSLFARPGSAPPPPLAGNG